MSCYRDKATTWSDTAPAPSTRASEVIRVKSRSPKQVLEVGQVGKTSSSKCKPTTQWNKNHAHETEVVEVSDRSTE